MNNLQQTNKEDDNFPRTLYVGNLSPQVSESLITELFGVIGAVKGCKMIADPNSQDPYCFVEYFSHHHALAAHSAMNLRPILGKEIKVNWATRPSGKRDPPSHHHIFVGDLAPETTCEDLRAFFAKVGEVADAKVMKDMTTNKSKGYGFVTFVNYQDAQDIVDKKTVLSESLHGRQVRCNWASRKNGTPQQNPKLDLNVVMNQSTQSNCTVYVGGCMSGLNDQLMREAFTEFGNIVEIRVFPDKGYAFVKMDNHADAARAIVAKHQTSLEGYNIKCSWGKEGTSSAGQQMNQLQYSNNNPVNQMINQMDGLQVGQWSQQESNMWNQQSQINQQSQQMAAWNQHQGGQQTATWNAWAPSASSMATIGSQQQQGGTSGWAATQQTSNSWTAGGTTGGQQQGASQNPWAPTATYSQQQQNWGWTQQAAGATGDGWNNRAAQLQQVVAGGNGSNGHSIGTWNGQWGSFQQSSNQQAGDPGTNNNSDIKL